VCCDSCMFTLIHRRLCLLPHARSHRSPMPCSIGNWKYSDIHWPVHILPCFALHSGEDCFKLRLMVAASPLAGPPIAKGSDQEAAYIRHSELTKSLHVTLILRRRRWDTNCWIDRHDLTHLWASMSELVLRQGHGKLNLSTRTSKDPGAVWRCSKLPGTLTILRNAHTQASDAQGPWPGDTKTEGPFGQA